VRALARVTDIPRFEPPDGLTARLRPYQETGYSWLSFLQEYGLGGVFADDMGLGKTVQTLAMILRARAKDPSGAPFLVVAPTSVVPNWADEAARFAPGLTVATVTGTGARRGTDLAAACEGADVVVTSYALFRLEYEAYESISWSGLLLDEAQQIKNHLSKGYRCARTLPAPFKLAITGTPMENNLMELWALFSIVAPGLLADPKRFTEHYRGPIERSQDADRLATLRRRIRPVLLRRTKAEVIADLPPKSEQVLELELLPKHRRVYQRYLQRERRKVLGLIGDMDRNRFQIFRSLTLLRQAALDVALLDEENASVPSTKLDALVGLVESAAAEGHRVLVFSQITRFLGRARAALDAAGVGSCYLDGATRHRASVLREFREGTAPVFLISLKAGGVGLNLTEADYCIITDPWWNPATEQQAVDRTHRIGQDKPVMVYRLVAAGTIEDKVMALKARKAALFSSIMTDGGVGRAGLTADDIRGLLS
jgi:SNF2 family DNA or RNA helicase